MHNAGSCFKPSRQVLRALKFQSHQLLLRQNISGCLAVLSKPWQGSLALYPSLKCRQRPLSRRPGHLRLAQPKQCEEWNKRLPTCCKLAGPTLMTSANGVRMVRCKETAHSCMHIRAHAHVLTRTCKQVGRQACGQVMRAQEGRNRGVQPGRHSDIKAQRYA